MKFQLKKTFYPFPVYEFNLPAGHSCPFARDCKIKVDRVTGKFDVIGKGYRCYAAPSERFPGVRESRWKNFEEVIKTHKIELPKDATHVRIHGSGDFFSQWYFDLWLQVARDNPKVKFWAFTKSIRFWIERLNEIPPNLTLQASYGSYDDDLIEKYHLKHAKVFTDRDEAIASGLPIDYDDTLAMSGNQSFALLDNNKYSKKDRGGD
jgi:hypothetical protein